MRRGVWWELKLTIEKTTVYEALENAGETWDSISGSRTGVYIGMFALDHVLMQSREWDYTKPYAATGAETSILANRISYVFNLHGPRYVIRRKTHQLSHLQEIMAT